MSKAVSKQGTGLKIPVSSLAPEKAKIPSPQDVLAKMSQEEKQKIKDRIGSVILAHLKNLTIRIILQKTPKDRSKKDAERLVRYLKGLSEIEAYKEFLTESDFKQLASKITYRQMNKDDFVYKIGESADEFFILLEGVASEEIKNESIEQWDWAMSVFNALLQWKSSVFDELAQKSLTYYRVMQKRKQDLFN